MAVKYLDYSGLTTYDTKIKQYISAGYQPLNSKLTSISGLASNVTGLIKLTNGVASVDTTSYVPTSRTINTKALSNNITLYAGDIAISSSDSTTIASKFGNYQPLNNILTSVSGLATNKTGLIKITNGTASIDENTYLTGITSSMVTTALGYTPYNATNPNGYISGITSSMVTTALGYTPYDSSNPSGYITSSALSDYVTLATAQNITATKTFTSVNKSNAVSSESIVITDSSATNVTKTTTLNTANGLVLRYNMESTTYGRTNIKTGSYTFTLPSATGTLALTSQIPTTTSALTNDSGYITNSVNTLTNYYKKTETYTQAEVDALISTIPKFAIEVVNSLPTTDISTTTIYLLRTSETETGNLYTEYIYVNNAWESLGTQTLDLTNYVTTNTAQTISGAKSFTSNVVLDNSYLSFKTSSGNTILSIVPLQSSVGTYYTPQTQNGQGYLATTSHIVPNYSSSSTYVVGQCVTMSGYIYQCNTAITTPEAWNNAHWTNVYSLNPIPITETEINALFS